MADSIDSMVKADVFTIKAGAFFLFLYASKGKSPGFEIKSPAPVLKTGDFVMKAFEFELKTG